MKFEEVFVLEVLEFYFEYFLKLLVKYNSKLEIFDFFALVHFFSK